MLGIIYATSLTYSVHDHFKVQEMAIVFLSKKQVGLFNKMSPLFLFRCSGMANANQHYYFKVTMRHALIGYS